MNDQPTETVKPMTVAELDSSMGEWEIDPGPGSEVWSRIRAALVHRELLLGHRKELYDKIDRIARTNADRSRLSAEAPDVAD